MNSLDLEDVASHLYSHRWRNLRKLHDDTPRDTATQFEEMFPTESGE